MRIYWDDNGRGIEDVAARAVTLDEALAIWSDEIGGTRGNFLGLIDERGETIQFYLDEDVADSPQDAGLRPIVLMDFPQAASGGSFSRHVRIGDVDGFIRKAFEVGADPRHFEPLTFIKW